MSWFGKKTFKVVVEAAHLDYWNDETYDTREAAEAEACRVKNEWMACRTYAAAVAVGNGNYVRGDLIESVVVETL
jgi:hypothetical protein